MLSTKVVEVDSRIAKLYLSYELKPEVGKAGTNRNRSQQVINDYKEAMLAGEWRLTHQGLAFKGTLDGGDAVFVDGGHRLDALLQAAQENPKIKIPFMVTEGLTEEDMLAMDIGRKRTPGDFMRMNGEDLSVLLAATIKLTWLYMNDKLETYDVRRKVPMSPRARQKHLDTYPDLRLAVREGARLKRVLAASAASSFWFLAVNTGYDEQILAEFMEGVYSGENLSAGDGRLTLRELMNNSRRLHRHWETHEQLALMIKAFLRWQNGEEVKQLGFRVDETFPKL